MHSVPNYVWRFISFVTTLTANQSKSLYTLIFFSPTWIENRGRGFVTNDLIRYQSNSFYYITLNRIEDAFRSMKSTLGMRPVYHQKEHRVDAHLFITILAYHIMHSIYYILRQAGVDWNWESIRKILNNHVRLTSVMKEQNGNRIHIRKNSPPNPWQKKIYAAMDMSHVSAKTEKTVFDKNGNVVTE